MHFVPTSPMAQGFTAGVQRKMVQLLVATGLLVLVAACEAPATDTTNKDVQDDAATDVGSLTTDVLAETDVGSDAEPATDTGPDVGPDAELDASTDADGAAQTDAVSETDADNTSDTGAETGPDAAPDAAGTDAQDSPDAGTSDVAIGTDAVVVPACSKNSDCPQVAGGCVVAICAAGQCLPQLLPEGSACSDSNPCTASAACKGGACTALGSVACDDGQPCTADSCDTASGLCVTHTGQRRRRL
jgi:hypothetical protein